MRKKKPLPQDLASIIARHCPANSIYNTSVPSLSFARQDSIAHMKYGFFTPCLCIIAQGAKDVCLADERFRYTSTDFLISAADVPVSTQILPFNQSNPYLSVKLEFAPKQILDTINIAKIKLNTQRPAGKALFVGKLDPKLLESVTRLARLVESPDDIPVLAPMFTTEIIYRLLKQNFGYKLAQIAINGTNAYHIQTAIKMLMLNFQKNISIQDLAVMTNMSTASFHRHFKDLTLMTPMQFQKQLRLQEARRLMLAGEASTADAAFAVGYESSAQFSREYLIFFGNTPKDDIQLEKDRFFMIPASTEPDTITL